MQLNFFFCHKMVQQEIVAQFRIPWTEEKNLTHRFFESEVRANKRQWDWDAEPEREEGNEGAEGNGCTASLHPENQVQHKEYAEHDPTIFPANYS